MTLRPLIFNFLCQGVLFHDTALLLKRVFSLPYPTLPRSIQPTEVVKVLHVQFILL